jgi:hypothetical protein
VYIILLAQAVAGRIFIILISEIGISSGKLVISGKVLFPEFYPAFRVKGKDFQDKRTPGRGDLTALSSIKKVNINQLNHGKTCVISET